MWDKNIRVKSDIRNHSPADSFENTLIGDNLLPRKKMPSQGLCSHPFLCVRKHRYFKN